MALEKGEGSEIQYPWLHREPEAQAGLMAHAHLKFPHSKSELCEFKACLLYIASSRPARGTYGDFSLRGARGVGSVVSGFSSKTHQRK